MKWNEWTKGLNEWLTDWMNEWNGRMDEWMNEWTNERMTVWSEWMNELVKEWMSEWMNEWRKLINAWITEICKLYLPKVLWRCQICTVSMWNPALATVSCAFCRPHLPKVLRTWQSFTIFVWNLATVSCAFGWPHLPRVLRHWQLKKNKCKSSSSYSPVHVLSATFADRSPQPRKQRPYFGDHGSHFNLTEKNTEFRARKSCQAWTNSRFPDPLHFPTTWCWYGWHDDVVDMMVRMLAMTIVRNSEVF